MSLGKWEKKFQEQREAGGEIGAPAGLVVETTRLLKPGRALDLACGGGRNALWLAQQGWNVTAVDGAPSGIELLRDRARRAGLHVEARVADLEKREFLIEPEAWDLILLCCYLQRDLFEPAKQGTKPGGILLVVILLSEGDGDSRTYSLQAGELRKYFEGWEILHYREGKPVDAGDDGRAVAEIVARRPDR